MTAVYTYSEAGQNLASLPDRAASDGEVRVRRRDGRVFIIRPAVGTASPLDVPGADLPVTTDEIVSLIREARRSFDR